MFAKSILAGLALGGAALSWAQTLDLNQASEMELDGLLGLGPALTRSVMQARQQAPFQSWEDASRRVKGLGPHKARSLSEQGVRIQGRAYERPASDAAPSARPAASAGQAPG